MTAAWKQKKFERLAKKDVVEDLKGQIKILQEKIVAKNDALRLQESRIENVMEQRDEMRLLAERYYKLRSQEIMVVTPDGFKLVTGEELDIHCGGQRPMKPAKYSYTFGVDETVDTWKYVAPLYEIINSRIAESMVHKSKAVKEVEKHGDTRSKSKETNQEDTR